MQSYILLDFRLEKKNLRQLWPLQRGTFIFASAVPHHSSVIVKLHIPFISKNSYRLNLLFIQVSFALSIFLGLFPCVSTPTPHPIYTHVQVIQSSDCVFIQPCVCPCMLVSI